MESTRPTNNPFDESSTHQTNYADDGLQDDRRRLRNIEDWIHQREMNSQQVRGPLNLSTTRRHSNDDTITHEVPVKTVNQISVSDSAFRLTSFTGAANDYDTAMDWLEQFDQYAKFANIDANSKLQLFHLLLKGPARTWLRSLPSNTRDDLDELIAEFKNTYSLSLAENGAADQIFGHDNKAFKNRSMTISHTCRRKHRRLIWTTCH